MKFLLFIVCLFAASTGSSQYYIGKSKSKVISQFEKYLQRDSIKGSITKVEDTLIIKVRDAKKKPMDFIYSFNNKGKCFIEKTIAYCDTCYNKFTEKLLLNKSYNWKKLNDKLYVSEYGKKLQLELYKEDSYTFILRKINWSKREYAQLVRFL